MTLRAMLAVIAWAATIDAGHASAASVLRVCADPNNLPFSNRQEEGFENKIAQLLARDLGVPLRYDWYPQRRGYLRNTINAGRCDVIIGIAAGVGSIDTTVPYYRSSYVFVSRRDHQIKVDSFDSPLLRTLRIGVQIIGDDYANTPPVHALAIRGIFNVHGYRVLGDYQQANPPARIIDAVAKDEIDVAVAWGPLAGYFAKKCRVALQIQLVATPADPMLPFAYDISMGVRPKEPFFKARIESAMRRNKAAIQKILADYGVPIVRAEVRL